MKKLILVLLCSTISMFLNAQKADNSLIVGTWQLKSINCEKYFSYDGYKKEFKIGEEMKSLLAKIPAADSKAASEAMPGLVAKDVQQTYFLFETNSDYIAISTDSVEVGSFKIYDQFKEDYKNLELNQEKSRKTLTLKKDRKKKLENM